MKLMCDADTARPLQLQCLQCSCITIAVFCFVCVRRLTSNKKRHRMSTSIHKQHEWCQISTNLHTSMPLGIYSTKQRKQRECDKTVNLSV
jgi:hypothetical protein